MSRLSRNNSVTAVALFLEGCALYLVFITAAALIDQPGIILPFWLVLLALAWSFVLMSYILSANVNPRIRGLVGLAIGIPSLLILAHMNTGSGYVPFGTLISGDVDSIVPIVGTLVFLIAVWWRGAGVAKQEITLEAVRSAFLWGLVVLFATALLDSMVEERLVSGFLVVGFFAVGLLGLSLARFSSESGDTHVMSREWVMPIVVSVAAVLLFGLVISAIGLGGLDDVTRETLSFGGKAGSWVLRPIFVLTGLIVSLIVGFANWISGMFGGGDLSVLMNLEGEIEEFHREIREDNQDKETSTVLFTAMKWCAFVIAASAAGWLLYRLFRSRRFMGREDDVEETRESLFTWSRANDDLSGMLAAWWNKMFPVQERGSGGAKEPVTPREFYHGLLGLAARLGRPRRDWETPNEHQRRLWGLLPADPVYRIVQRFQRSHYGRYEQDDTVIDSLREDWTQITEFVDREEL